MWSKWRNKIKPQEKINPSVYLIKDFKETVLMVLRKRLEELIESFNKDLENTRKNQSEPNTETEMKKLHFMESEADEMT